MTSALTAAYTVGSVAFTVSLVLVNKTVFSGGFAYPMTLSFFHFVFTVIWYQCLAVAGAYTKPPPDAMSPFEKFKVAAAVFSSIGFMNLSLNANSVGFYQITKLTIIPVTLAINSFAYGVHTSSKIKVSLVILLSGVGVATVSEVRLRALGVVYGVLAVLTTALCQIWQGSKQKEFGISATQLQAVLAPYMSAQALVVALATEVVGDHSASEYFQAAVFGGDSEKQQVLGLVLGTCFLALLVNLCSFGLIGNTSAVTFQVVGHAKTCLVLAGGYIFFPSHIGRRRERWRGRQTHCPTRQQILYFPCARSRPSTIDLYSALFA